MHRTVREASELLQQRGVRLLTPQLPVCKSIGGVQAVMNTIHVYYSLVGILMGIVLASCNYATTPPAAEPDLEELRSVAQTANFVADRVKRSSKYDLAAQEFVRSHAEPKSLSLRVKTHRVLAIAWEVDFASRELIEDTIIEMIETSEGSPDAMLHWMFLNNLRGFGFKKPVGTILAEPISTSVSQSWIENSLETIDRAEDHAHRAWAVVEFVNAAGKSRSARDGVAQALTSGNFADEPFQGFWDEFAKFCLERPFPADEE